MKRFILFLLRLVPSHYLHISGRRQFITFYSRDWSFDNNVVQSTRLYFQEANPSLSVSEIHLANTDSILLRSIQNRSILNSSHALVLDVRFLFVSAYSYQIPLILIETLFLFVLLRLYKVKLFLVSPDYDSPAEQLLAEIICHFDSILFSLGQIPYLATPYAAFERRGPIPLTLYARDVSSQFVSPQNRDIDLFIGGSIYGLRCTLYHSIHKLLVEIGYNCFFAEKHALSYLEYLHVLSRSKLTFVSSFHSSSAVHFPKLIAMGKVSEASMMGTVVISHQNPALDLLYQPRSEYIDVLPDASPEHIVSEVIDHLRNPDCISLMSHNARLRTIVNDLSYLKLFRIV